MLDPKTLRVICVRCAVPDQAKRDALERALIQDAIARFREEHGRLPDPDELIEWLDGNVGGERGRLHLTGPMLEDAD
jgi:hypothetical protein